MLSGIIIKGYPGIIREDESSIFTFFKVVRSYFSSPARRKTFEVAIGTHRYEIQTDKFGKFEITVPKDLFELKNLSFERKNKGVPILQDYPILYKKVECPFIVISDIDDTILVSYSVKIFKKLALLLSRSPAKRKPVVGTEEAYKKLASQGLSFHYVSRSEQNLFYLITSFLTQNNLPIGAVFLRPFVTWRRLLHKRKDHHFKIDEISSLIENSTNQQVILFGDDSQKDLEDFTILAEKYPGKVFAIFIRETGLNKVFNPEPVRKKASEAGWQMYYYNEFADIAEPINDIIHEASNRC